MNALKRIPRTRLVATGAGLIVLALSAAWYLWPDPGPDDHHTNPDALSMAISQTELDEIAELHTQVDGEPVTEVLGTAHGALLVLDHGVVAVSDEQWEDQRKGEWPEQWRYIDAAPVTDVKVLPEDVYGEAVALIQGQPGQDDHSVTLLESQTGTFRGSADFGGRYSPADDLHFSPNAVLQRVGDTLTVHPMGNNGEKLSASQEPTWSMDSSDLCPNSNEPDGVDPGVTPTIRGFVVSQRCADPDSGKEMHVLSHQHDMVSPASRPSDSPEVWNRTWEDVDPDRARTQVHYLSPAVTPDSPEDATSALLDGDRTGSYALAVEEHFGDQAPYGDPEYFEPSLFEDWEPQGYFSEPLVSIDEYPEDIVFSESIDIDAHVSMQAAKLLIQDPDIDFDRTDSVALRWEISDGWAEPQSFRAPIGANFKPNVNGHIQDALS